jgi:UMF1 family MFS transporter
LYASFVPEGRNAEFFAFFAMSDKVSAMLGPLTYGTILTLTGNTRIALGSLAMFFLVGGGILFTVNVAKGQDYARTAS